MAGGGRSAGSGSRAKATPRQSRKKRSPSPPTAEGCLTVGTEVMRRCSVTESRESGLGHLRGVVKSIQGSRVVVAWTNSEETLSLRRAQTFADAFERLPETHEFRRRSKRCSPPTPKSSKRQSTPQPKNSSAKKRRSDESPQIPKKVLPAAALPSPAVIVLEKSKSVIEPRGKFSAKKFSSKENRPPPNVVKFTAQVVDELRHRKANPAQKVEWHGGAGFGNSSELWINVGEGKFKAQADINNAEATTREEPP